jgi:hypothetical protein
MAVASGLSLEEISLVADWYLTEDALKAASIDIINRRPYFGHHNPVVSEARQPVWKVSLRS